MTDKKLAITMGDPAGVGPEVCLMLLQQQKQKSLPPVELTIYGDHAILERVATATGLPLPDESQVRHIPSLPDAGAVVPGKVSADCGRAAYEYLITAIDAALAGDIDGLITAPLNKEALHAAEIHFPGHTEILATRTNSDRTCMLQYSNEVTASFVTCHCGYAEVTQLLTRERLCEVIDLTHEAVGRINKRPPRMIALGLNPHAGEHGLFGQREEERIILPEVEAARARGIDISGPIPPDTAFIPSTRRNTDAFICMYHDQGHIPLKALAFDSAVNVTLGLPIVRTSVDHGTAFNIAWTGAANPGSILSATRLAIDLCSIT
ncbi:MAG: 4-hydroxythreonine-4-phosphate dehydrogenase PdxA [Verrucomicrobia bacterium]|nr:4-hydroxythreonine-4-phosphate dehydrogenase PdxA [Verrucomicrobiota bacterium]